MDIFNGNSFEFKFPGSIVWHGFTPAPELKDETFPVPVFDGNGLAEFGGLKLQRRISALRPGMWTVNLTITNCRKDPVSLRNLTPVKFSGDGLSLGVAFDRYLVYRLARQKNDIPGVFRPAIVDRNMRDASFSSAEVVAGGGISWSEFDSPDAVLPCSFDSDPGMVIAAEGLDCAVFVGFNGQTRHLNNVRLTTSEDRSSLESLTTIAEFDDIALAPGESRTTHDLVIELGLSSEKLFKNHVDRIADQYGSRHSPYRNIFCTWYYYGPNIDEKEVLDNLREIGVMPFGMDVFQIDMGWENNFGDWEPDLSKFPDGIAVMATEIKKAGMVPGIWTCPFVIEPSSSVVQRYPDVLLLNQDGSPCIFKCDKGDCFVLDPFAPDAGAYLNEFFAKLNAWGFSYHKLDFLRAVFIFKNARFYQPGKTRAEAYRRGLELIREAAGEQSVINACGGLFEGSSGLADIVRSGADLRGHWGPEGSNICAYVTRIKQNIFRNFYQRLWTVDPDALQLRRNTLPWKDSLKYAHLSMGKFTDEEAFSILVNQFLAGGIACVSERFSAIDPDRLMLLQHLLPNVSDPAEPFGVKDLYLPELFSSRFHRHGSLPPWNVISMCNWNEDDEKMISFSLLEVPGLPEADSYGGFEFKTQTFLGVFKREDCIALLIPAHGCRVVRLTPIAAEGTHLVGTDLNLSCGMELSTVCNGRIVPREGLKDVEFSATMLELRNGNMHTSKILHKPSRRDCYESDEKTADDTCRVLCSVGVS